MILSIDTSDNVNIKVSLEGDGRILGDLSVPAARAQAEELLGAIEKLLIKARAKLKDLSSVRVANRGGSFTSLRIGVATANALGYALGIKVLAFNGQTLKKNNIEIVEPVYDRAPNIFPPKKIIAP